ncbi:MAG: SHOCT domain-containing protein [Solirubrobacteraceae bacterium]
MPSRAPRRHRGLIGTLFVLATLFGIVSIHAVWINRQALNTDNWTATSSQLLANKEIQTAVAAYAVNALFSSGAPQAELKEVLPKPLEGLAGPLSSGLEQLAARVAPRILASSQVETAWREANRAAHSTLIKIINGGGSRVSTNNGVVTLNLHNIITDLAGALGVQTQVSAGLTKLKANAGTVRTGAATVGITLPATLGSLVIMRSDQLGTVQDIAGDIRGAALWTPILAIALFVLAIWLSAGRRREALRRTGWCFVLAGVFALLDRRVAGNEVINALVRNPDNKPAAHQAWAIATTLLYDISVAVIVYGLIIVVAAWIAGHTRPATALRRALAPTLREQPVAAYVGVYVALLLVILWGPTPATRQLPYIIGLIVVLALGVHALRVETAREFPDAQAGDTGRAIRALFSERRRPSVESSETGGSGRDAERVAELERLASLHDRGSLTDEEFAAEKAVLMNGV